MYLKRLPSCETVNEDPTVMHVSIDAGGVVGRILMNNFISVSAHDAILSWHDHGFDKGFARQYVSDGAREPAWAPAPRSGGFGTSPPRRASRKTPRPNRRRARGRPWSPRPTRERNRRRDDTGKTKRAARET